MITRNKIERVSEFVKNSLYVPQIISKLENVISKFDDHKFHFLEVGYCPMQFTISLVSSSESAPHTIIQLSTDIGYITIIFEVFPGAVLILSSLIIIFPNGDLFYNKTTDDVLTGKELYKEFEARDNVDIWSALMYLMAMHPEIDALTRDEEEDDEDYWEDGIDYEDREED